MVKVLVSPAADTFSRVLRGRALGSTDIIDDVVALKSIVPGETAASADFRHILKAKYAPLGGGGATGDLSILKRIGSARMSTICRIDLLEPSSDTGSPVALAMVPADCSGIVRPSAPPQFISAIAQSPQNHQILKSTYASRYQPHGPGKRSEGTWDALRWPCRSAHANSSNMGYTV